MIPQKIHWCWLSNDPIPDNIQECIDTWKNIMPDYKIKCWTTKEFDVNSVAYVKEAYTLKKWAFATDYIRLYALYNEGGIYLDSDVKVFKSFDIFLKNDFFSGIEYYDKMVEALNSNKRLNADFTRKKEFDHIPGIGIQAAVIGAQKGHPFIEDILAFYQSKHFIEKDGTLYTQIIAPDIYAQIAEKYGFIYKNIKQELSKNIVLYPSNIFSSGLIYPETYALHLAAHSWRPMNIFQNTYSRLGKNPIFVKLGKIHVINKMISQIRKLIWYK